MEMGSGDTNQFDDPLFGRGQYDRSRYGSVSGTIVEMVPARMGSRRADGCMIFVTVEDAEGNTVNVVLTPSAYVVDFETLSVGMLCTFWYRTDAPMPLIYPPQYNAVAAACVKNSRMVEVGYFDSALVNEQQTLQLNLDGSVELRTTNNQYFQGNPTNHDLVVIYDHSTRSIPAQTTPSCIVVLCSQG